MAKEACSYGKRALFIKQTLNTEREDVTESVFV